MIFDDVLRDDKLNKLDARSMFGTQCRTMKSDYINCNSFNLDQDTELYHCCPIES